MIEERSYRAFRIIEDENRLAVTLRFGPRGLQRGHASEGAIRP